MAHPMMGSSNWGSFLNLNRGVEGDFDVRIEFEVESFMSPTKGASSLLAFQFEVSDSQRTRYHPLVVVDSDGKSRLSVHRQWVTPEAGEEGSIVFEGSLVSRVTALRINRMGERITVLASSPDWEGERILAERDEPSRPISRGGIRFFLHAGGADAKASVLMKTFSLRADVIR